MFRLVTNLEYSEAMHFLIFSSRVQTTASRYSSVTFNIFFATSKVVLSLISSRTQNFVLRLLDIIFCYTEIIYTPKLEFKKPIFFSSTYFFILKQM